MFGIKSTRVEMQIHTRNIRHLCYQPTAENRCIRLGRSLWGMVSKAKKEIESAMRQPFFSW